MTDTGIPVPRPSEPYRIREDGIKLYLYKSPNNVFMIQHPTGAIYPEARDPESATYTYTESDEPIPELETNIPVEGGDDMDEQRLREIENRLDQHDEDIEANAEGIQELADIIGGGE